MQKKHFSIFILLFALLPLKAQAGITMSNLLEFVFDKNELGEIEQAELSLSQDGSAWGLKFKQAEKEGQEIWRIGIYFEGNFRILKKEFLIPTGLEQKEKQAYLQGPILSPQGKRWGLIYYHEAEQCQVLINLETFGPFYRCEQLKFSATDNFSFIVQKSANDKKQQLYSRVIRKMMIHEKNKRMEIQNFIPSTDKSGLPKIVYSPDGSHWLLAACIMPDKCYVQEKGNKTAKGPFQTVSDLYYWGNWEKKGNRAWAIRYLKNDKEQVLIKMDNTEKILPPSNEGIELFKLAHSQHQAKAWGFIYEDQISWQNGLFINAKQLFQNSNIDALSFAPNGHFIAYSYRETARENWQTDIYSLELEKEQLKKQFTAETCREVDCDFQSVEQLTISDDPTRFWGYVGMDIGVRGKQYYLVIFENQSHWRTLGPFKDIQGPYITPDGHSWGMRYSSSYENEIGYYIYDRYAGLSKYENISWGSHLHFSSENNKLIWGFVYKGRKNHNENPRQYYVIINGTKITSREGKLNGFSHARLAQLKKSGENTKVFSLIYLDKVTAQQTYRIRVNKIEQPYITVNLAQQPWATSHTPNVGYRKVLQIGTQDFCQDSNEPEIERVCIEKLNSSKIAALRLFFKRLGLERGKTKLEIHQCEYHHDRLHCRKPIITASQLIEFIKDKEGITNYAVNKTNFWLDIPLRGLPIQMRYEVTGDFELLGHSRLEYPFGYEITQIEYMPVEQK